MVTQEGLAQLLVLAQVVGIIVAAWLLRRLVLRLIRRMSEAYNLPATSLPGGRRLVSLLINAAALLLILQRLGVSGTVLWTAFSGFVAVGAVAFFAAWSVLSNIFCTLLIFSTNPFRIGDRIEVLENGEKPGFKGRVTDINLIYTTLEELNTEAVATGTVLQVPNNMFFQRAVRRWR